jgi:hypothetical protein
MSQILINRSKNAHGQSITWAEKDRRSPSSAIATGQRSAAESVQMESASSDSKIAN